MTHDDSDLMRAAATLPRELEPERDLWPGIAARLTPPAAAQRPRRWPLALAAGIALVAVTAGLTWHLAQLRQVPEPVQAFTALDGSVQQASPVATSELTTMRLELVAALRDNLSRLPPASQRVIVDNLIEIRTSLAAIEQALQADPGNPSLQQLLYTTYEQELTVLAEVNRLALSFPAEVEI